MARLALAAVIVNVVLMVCNCHVLPGEKAVEDSEENIDEIANREYDTVHGRILAVNAANEKKREMARIKQPVFAQIEHENEAKHVKPLYQGDIVLDKDLETLIHGKGKTTKRNAVRYKSRLWTSRTIPYYVPSDMGHIYTNLQLAINEFHTHTCLRFVSYNGQRNYIHFNQANGCSSKVGKKYNTAGLQYLSIGNGCNNVGVIIHELLHALGFWHEQARADRDKFVKINWENIQTGFSDQFDKYSWKTIDDLGKDYDYQSIMHYDRKAFTKNGLPTIQAIHDPNMDFGTKNARLSPKDIIEINALYDCKTTQYGWSSWSAYTPCDNGCYKSRERYCYHSGNIESCGGNVNVYGIEKDTVKCPVGECPAPVDGHWGAWSSWSTCTVTCNDGVHQRSRVCNNPAPLHGGKSCPGDANESNVCVMKRCHLDADDTDFEGGRMGIWSNAKDDQFDWTLKTGFTPGAYTGPMSDHTSGSGYYMYIESSAPRVANDKAKLVTGWIPYMAGGHCLKFHYHMYGSTVGSLSVEMEIESGVKWSIFLKSGDQKNEWKSAMGNIDPPVNKKYKLTIQATVGNVGYSDIAIDDVYIDPGHCTCQDEFVTCAKWAVDGECQKNSLWMGNNCKRSCRTCPTTSCSDSYDVQYGTQQCPLWAGQGACVENKVWMEGNCAKSCFICGCADSDPAQCAIWKSQGECTANTAYMWVKCIKTCNACSCHDYDTKCEYWASQGECPKNEVWMKANCRRSCKVCTLI